MLTKGQRSVLERMNSGADLVFSDPGGWWCDDDRVSGQVAWSLVRLVLVSSEAFAGSALDYYHINEEGRAALADENYVPIARALLDKKA